MPNAQSKRRTGGNEQDLLQYIKPNTAYFDISSRTNIYDNLVNEEIQRTKNINSLIKKYNKFKHKKILSLDEKSQLDNIIKALAEYDIYPEQSTILYTHPRQTSLSPIISPNTSPRRTSSGGSRKFLQKFCKPRKRCIKKQDGIR